MYRLIKITFITINIWIWCVFRFSVVGAADCNPGDRAPHVVAWDIVNQRTTTLDDYLGQWVLLDFWASWCGPCIADMPETLAAVARFAGRDRLSFVTVSVDEPENLAALKRVIREQQIDFPVLYDGLGWHSPGLVSWRLPKQGIPRQYLINPAGVIVSSPDSSNLAHHLEYFIEQQDSVIGLRSRSEMLPDGTIRVLAEVMSSDHRPLELQLNLIWERYRTRDAEPAPVFLGRDYEFIRSFDSAVLEFELFGDTVHEFNFRPDQAWDNLRYSLSIDLAPADSPGGEPLRIYCSGTQEFEFSELRHEDGEWRVYRPAGRTAD